MRECVCIVASISPGLTLSLSKRQADEAERPEPPFQENRRQTQGLDTTGCLWAKLGAFFSFLTHLTYPPHLTEAHMLLWLGKTVS